jgi:hypothetical protein
MRFAGIFRGGEGKCAEFKRGIGQQPAREEQVLYSGRAAGAMVCLGARPEVEAEIDRFGSFLHVLKNVELNQFRGDVAGSRLPASTPPDGVNEEISRVLIFDGKERGYKEHDESFRVVEWNARSRGRRGKGV